MAVFRIEKNNNYSIMSNWHLREKNMSLKAKGLLSVMLSLPQDWDYSIAGLVAICNEKETAIKATLNELKRFGYLEVKKILPNETKSGRIEYEYIIYEQKQGNKKQGVENLPLEFLSVENHGQINTNITNTDVQNTNQYNINKSKRTVFVKPTVDEVAEFCKQNELDLVDPAYFIDHYEANGWYAGQKKMSDWQATVRNWQRREVDKRKQYPYKQTYRQPQRVIYDDCSDEFKRDE